MRNQIASFHYLTQDMPGRTHERQVLMACEAGVKWIQLRMKKGSLQERMRTAKIAREITSYWNATLIINDHVEIADAVKANGVHLGKEDMPWNEAREVLGNERIIGLSTHSLEDILAVRNAAVDYLGLGPFRFTTTKENIDPVLGINMIRDICERMKNQKISRPIIAIGGIHLDDVHDLFATGINGVAISSAINLSGDPIAATKIFLNRIHDVLSSKASINNLDESTVSVNS